MHSGPLFNLSCSPLRCVEVLSPFYRRGDISSVVEYEALSNFLKPLGGQGQTGLTSGPRLFVSKPHCLPARIMRHMPSRDKFPVLCCFGSLNRENRNCPLVKVDAVSVPAVLRGHGHSTAGL